MINDLEPLDTRQLVKRWMATTRDGIAADLVLARQPPTTCTCRALRAELLPFYYRTKCRISVRANSDMPAYADRPAWNRLGRKLQRGVILHAAGAWLGAIGSVNRGHVRGITYENWKLDEGQSTGAVEGRKLAEVPLRLEMVESAGGAGSKGYGPEMRRRVVLLE